MKIVVEGNNLKELINNLATLYNKEVNKEMTQQEGILGDKAFTRLKNKFGFSSKNDVADFLDKIYSVNKMAAFSIVLRELALIMDEEYNNHIKICKEVFIISVTDGTIRKISTNKIKSFKNFAAFRTLAEARTACRILREFLKDMFSNEK